VNDTPGRFGAANAWALGLAAILAGVSAALPVPRPAAPQSWDPAGFASNPLWNDGLAEVSRYAARRTVYGRPQDYELVQIVVKELYDPATRTKPEKPRPGAIEALKLLRVYDVPTHRPYRYRQAVVVRVACQDPRRVLDASLTSSEWCGNTFALVVPDARGLVRHVHSYFDGEGDREDVLPATTWLDDQLALTLRAMKLEDGETLTVDLLPSLVSNRQPRSTPSQARLTVARSAEGPDAAVVTVEAANARSTYLIGRGPGRPLLKVEGQDGSRATLASSERSAYWLDPR
jgi:hypothetical protein